MAQAVGAVRTPEPAWRWIAEHFLVRDSETGRPRPFVVYPWLARVLDDVFPGGNTSLPYNLFVFSTIKKSGKTALNAAIAAYLAFERAPDGAELYNFANSHDQSVGRVYRAVKYAVEHSPALLARCTDVIGTSIRLRNGTSLQALAAQHANIAGANPYYSGWCVDRETEALTRAGFKPVVDLTVEDEVATLNPGTGKLEWHRPRAVNVTPYKGQMVRFRHRRADFLVTPNHRVYGRFASHSRGKQKAKERGWWFEEATDAAKFACGWLKADADWDGQVGFGVTLARFIGYYIADGHSPSPGTVHITKSRDHSPDVYEAIRQTVEELGCSHSLYPGGIRIKSLELADLLRPLGKSADKYVPEDLKNADTETLSAFFNAYMQCDGWRPTTKSRGWQCITISDRLANDLMEIGLKLGFQPRWMNTRKRRDAWAPQHRLSFSVGPVAWERTYDGKKGGEWSEEYYEGLIACPSVPHGIFYIRRNGKCCWTGNTELWGYEHEKELRAWEEMTPPPTVRDSIRVVDTYAGWEGESSLLNGIEDAAKASPRLYVDGYSTPAGYVPPPDVTDSSRRVVTSYKPDRKGKDGRGLYAEPLPVYVDVSTRTYVYWDEGEEARRMPWQQGVWGAAYYRSEAKTLRPESFNRLHLNVRSKRGGAFVDPEFWDACIGGEPWQPDDRRPVAVAIDAATKHDHMALVAVGLGEDGLPEERLVREWVPVEDERRPDGQLVIDPAAVVTALVALRDSGLSPMVVGYDPFQLHAVALKIEELGFRTFEFPQGVERLQADTDLSNRIRYGQMRHTGGAALTAAISNANAIEEKGRTGDLRRIRIVKGTGKVDAAVALSMASWLATNPEVWRTGKRTVPVAEAPRGLSLLGGASTGEAAGERRFVAGKAGRYTKRGG